MSTSSLADINAQIQKLQAELAQFQAEAERQRQEDMGSVVQELIEKISTYGITAKELGLNTGKTGKTDKTAKAKPGRKPLAAQIARSGKTHTGPEGQTWTEGTRGRKPKWLTEQSTTGDATTQ
jgi:DNA-binding protein H-NS